ncbi:hypothetical protein [Ligilactobacillus cholophilus]|uniref:hypothetical protein n=1 Tax=Ligilactobacillus cholophilus TaxID=3050131 RepID=UPI0025AEF640|nr:hypothetical protein [Ligilactobacillus cholophilus]
MSNFIKDFYTVTSQKLAQDERLSWKARGIFLYLSSMSEGWNFYVDEIANHSPGGVKELRTGLKELEQYGYLKRIQEHSNNGSFSKYKWLLCGNPHRPAQNGDDAKIGRTSKSDDAQTGRTLNGTLINNNNNKEQLIIKNNSNKLGCYVTDFYEKKYWFLSTNT